MIWQDAPAHPNRSDVSLGSLADVLLLEDLSQQRLPARTLAAALRGAGFRAELVDLSDSANPTQIIALTRRAAPRLIVFSILFADRLTELLSLIKSLRSAGVRAHIAITGPLPNFVFAELLSACPGLDSVLLGEAEFTVVELAKAAQVPVRWQTLAGIAYRLPGAGTPFANPPLRPKNRLDELDFPTYDNLPIYRGYPFATVQSSRGCYHNCTFCLPCAFYRERGAGYRERSVSDLADEIERLYRLGARLFLFDDEQFLPPKSRRVRRIALLHDELEHRRVQIAFTIKCRADDVDETLFERMTEFGLVRVYAGIESGSQTSLDLFGKRITPRQNGQALALLKNLGIVTDFRILMFHPWSTLDTIAADVAFLHDTHAYVSTPYDFREVEIYPGTALARRLSAEGRGEGEPWLPGYHILDQRAEVLRRLSRLLFGPASPYRRAQARLTGAWFGPLLRRRFHPGRYDAGRASLLERTIQRLNDETLGVWDEMLAFANEAGCLDSHQVNARAEDWVSRINAACAQTGERFSPEAV